MPARHKANPATQETEYRTFKVSVELLASMKARRKALGQTVKEFIRQAVETELPEIMRTLKETLPVLSGKTGRPARLPLTLEVLATLQGASEEIALPASRLLTAALEHASRRKRRRRGSKGGISRPRFKAAEKEKGPGNILPG